MIIKFVWNHRKLRHTWVRACMVLYNLGNWVYALGNLVMFHYAIPRELVRKSLEQLQCERWSTEYLICGDAYKRAHVKYQASKEPSIYAVFWHIGWALHLLGHKLSMTGQRLANLIYNYPDKYLQCL